MAEVPSFKDVKAPPTTRLPRKTVRAKTSLFVPSLAPHGTLDHELPPQDARYLALVPSGSLVKVPAVNSFPSYSAKALTIPVTPLGQPEFGAVLKMGASEGEGVGDGV